MAYLKTPGVAPSDTASRDYTDRLISLSGRWWKRFFNVQAPYQRNLRRLWLGRTLDVGCGIGRNVAAMAIGSVGVDHNEHSVAICNQVGLEAYTPKSFFSQYPRGSSHFDSILIAHVFEHLTADEDVDILREYLPYLKSGGQVVIITPQEAGFASDATHVEFMPFAKIEEIIRKAGLVTQRYYSFPFPRFFGHFFRYNEFIFIARKPDNA
jgi:SAM-dependent methyltransferase